MRAGIERYIAEDLLARDADIRVMRPPLRRVSVHWHDFYELGYITGGTGMHVVNGVERTVQRGSVFLLTPADFHEIHATSDEALSSFNVVIDPPAFERQLDELLPPGAADAPWWVGGFDEAETDFQRLWTESRSERPGADQMMDAVLRCILIELARRCLPALDHPVGPVADTGSGTDVRRAISYVDRHFREPMTLAQVSAQAHLSPNYFSERFRQATGVSFQTYLQNRRLRFAASLLAATDLGVTEVCHAAGFNSPSHFGRAYRRRFGAAPSVRRELLSPRGV